VHSRPSGLKHRFKTYLTGILFQKLKHMDKEEATVHTNPWRRILLHGVAGYKYFGFFYPYQKSQAKYHLLSHRYRHHLPRLQIIFI